MHRGGTEQNLTARLGPAPSALVGRPQMGLCPLMGHSLWAASPPGGLQWGWGVSMEVEELRGIRCPAEQVALPGHQREG